MREFSIHVEPVAKAQDRLEALLAQYQARDRMAPVTVVAPSTYAGLFLRRNIGERGMVNVRFMVLPRLTELLGAPSLAARGLRPLTPFVEYAAVRRATMEESGPLEQFREHSSFYAKLRSTFRELRYAEPNALAQLERRGGLSGHVVRLYRRFRDFTKSYYDRESLATAAREAVRTGRAAALHDLGPVILYLVRDLTPGERAFVEALASAGRCSLVFGVTGDEEADADSLALAASLGNPIRGDSEQAAADEKESRLLIAADTREEIRWIARSIAADAHRGVPFHRIGVFYWQREPYASLLAEQLSMAGVPATGPAPDTLASTAVGRTIKGMVELTGAGLARDAMMRWLTGCPIKLPARGFNPARWDVISRNAGVVAGRTQWRDRLARYAASLERSAGRGADEISEADAERMLQAARDARALRRFVLQVSDDLSPPDDGLPWPDFVDWILGLIDKYLDADALPNEEQESLDALRSGIGEMAALEDMRPGATFDWFRAMLDEACERPSARLGTFGEGVFVGPVNVGFGVGFEKVYLVGMIEGLVPSRISDDPLLPDRERAQFGLPLHGASSSKERYSYLAAMAAGQSRVLTFARSDTAARRSQHPSRWFQEEASRLDGSRVFATTLDSLGPRAWLDVVASQESGLRGVDDSQPADAGDYDLHRLWRWRRSGRRVAGHHMAADGGVLARALRMEKARTYRHLTVWDGDVSALSGERRKISPDQGAVFSPTRLEAWATCPYRYFLAHVLGIGALHQPEDAATITPLDRGSLVHSILERFIHEAKQLGDVPRPDQPWDEGHSRLLIYITEHECQDAEERGATGKPLLWEMAQAEIRGDLRAFLDEDSKMRRRYGVSPHSTELAFGTVGHASENAETAPHVEWSHPGVGTLRFRGIVDRIDTSPDGEIALVIDYKTGGTSIYDAMKKDPVDRGRRLQLPVYGLAARQHVGADVKVFVAYWFISTRGGFVMRPAAPVPLDELLEAFSEAVQTITAGIAEGLFPAHPGNPEKNSTENCTYCDFDRLCPQKRSRSRYWERKRGDPRLRPYVLMADGDPEQEKQ